MRLRTLSCPQCAAPVQLAAGEQTAACGACGTTASLDAALKEERRRAKRFPNKTPIRIGMRAKLHGREYEVIGRLVFSMVEEGETYYWDEWQLLAPDGDVLYLEYDEGRWKFTASFVPESPIGPDQASRLSAGSRVSLDGRTAWVQQVATATIRHLEGELTYAARVGESFHYLDASQGNRVYSVEWTDEEVSFYRGEWLSHRQVLVMFGLYAELAALEAAEKRAASKQRFAVVCLVAGFVAFLGWASSLSLPPRRVVGQGGAMIAQIPEAGLRFGPYTLAATRRVHRLRVNASLTEASAWVGAVIEAQGEQELLALHHDMWDESGYDSDGHWHESDLVAQTDFVPAQAGHYFVRLYAEPETGTARGGTAHFVLQEGVLYPWYLLWYSLIAFLIGGVFLLQSTPGLQEALKESLSSD